MHTVDVVIVSCDCGHFPLDRAMHSTSHLAWEAAAAHVALNPTKCHPSMSRSTAPAALGTGGRPGRADDGRIRGHRPGASRACQALT